MKARVSHLHKTEAEWKKLNHWTPAAGELVVYDPDENYSYSRIKIGDGKRSLRDLDFFIESIITSMLDQYSRATSIDAGRISSKRRKFFK